MRPTLRIGSVLAALVALIASPLTARADDTRAMRFERGQLVSPTAAIAYYGNTNTHSSSFTGVTGFEGRPPEIVEQAAALNNDVDLIYEYVRNHIEPEFAFGLRKGALGTLIDKSGTPFDQNVLFAELIRATGVSARYKIATITLTAAEFTQWTGVSDLASACRMLAFGGIPTAFNGASSSDADCNLTGTFTSVSMRHIWTEVNIAGTWYDFDPSFKVQGVAPRRALETEAGVVAGAVATQAGSGLETGTASGVPYIRLVNDANTDTWLAARSAQLQTALTTNAPSADMREVTGGKEIVADYAPESGFPRSSNPPYPNTDVVTVTGDIPNQYRTGFNVSATVGFGSINRQMWVDEIYGRRMELDSAFYADRVSNPGDYFNAEFRLELDDVSLDTVSNDCNPADNQYHPGCVLPGWTYSGTITVNHPYAAASGAYADASFTLNGLGAVSTAIMHGWGRVSPNLGGVWGQEKDEDRALPNRVAGQYDCTPEWLCNPDNPAPSGDVNRQRVAAAWLAQMSRMLDLQGEIGSSEVQLHHAVGTVQWGYSLSTFDPLPLVGSNPVDFGVADQQLIINAGTSVSVSSRISDAARTRAVSRAIALASATLEGSVVEQMQDLPDGTSTAARLAWGNRPDTEDPCPGVTRRRFYDYSGTSSATRTPLILFDGLASGCDYPTPVMLAVDRSAAKSALNGLVGQLVADGYSVSGSAESFLGPGARWGTDLPSDGTEREPSVQRGGAVIGNLFDVNGEVLSVAHLMSNRYGPSKGGGGSAPERSGTTFDAKKAADVLKDRFVDRSSALGVSLSSGAVGYSTPTLLSAGAGDGAPYRLDYGLTYQAGPTGCSGLYGPCTGPIQSGWTHSWDIRFSLSGSGMEAMGATSPLAATDTVTAFMAIQDVFYQSGLTNLRKDIYGSVIADWWRRRMVGNVATVNRGFQASQYIRQAGNSWLPPVGSPGVLTQTGVRTKTRDVCAATAGGAPEQISTARRWDQTGVAFSLRQADGQVLNFAPWSTTYTADGCSKLYGFRLTEWTWPQGPSLIFSGTYGAVSSLTSSLGRTLQVGAIGTTGGRTAGLVGFNGFRDSANDTWTFTYTQPGVRSATTRPRPFGRLFQVYEPTNIYTPALQYAYDSLGRVSEAYDAVALQWRIREPYRFRIAEGARGERIDPAGGHYTVYYDTDGDPARHLDELSRLIASTFDGRHRVASRTYPEGDSDHFAYDARDNVVELRRVAKPTLPASDIVVEAAWNATWNKPAWIEDALNRRTNFAYYAAGVDGAGLLQTATQPAVGGVSPVWAFEYNDDGLVDREIDPTGRVTAHVYNAAGSRTSTTTGVAAIGAAPALNLTTTFTPDTWGDAITVLDPRGYASTYQYDAMRRPTAEQRREGGATAIPITRSETLYDLLGRPTRVRGASALDGAGAATAWAATTTTYTPNGKPWRVTDPDGRITTSTYDGLDRPLTTISAEGDVTAFNYDAAGQLLTETRGVASMDEILYGRYAYTLNGQRNRTWDGNNNRTDYRYDGFDRLERTLFPFPDTGLPNLGDDEFLTYDATGAVLTRRTRRDVTITNTYDALGRVSTTTVPAHGTVAARTTTHGYDLAGRQTALSDTYGHALAYAHDAAGRLLSTTTSGPQWSGSRAVSYRYDAAGNRTRVTWPDTWYVNYGYDAANRMTSASQGGSFTLATFDWDPLSRREGITWPGGASMAAVHSPAGNQTSRALAWTSGGVSWTNTYDFVRRLTGETISSAAFRWSPPGGTTAYVPDRLNRYATVGGVAQSHDLNGNLTGDGTWTYVYDAENRLLSADRSGLSADYLYDPLGRRVEKTVNGVATAFLSDGDDEIAEYDGAGALVRRFVQGPMIDQPIAQIDAGGTRRLLMQDRLGSVVGALSDTGALSDGPYVYDPYGLPNTTAGMPFRYTGRRYDAETGLYYYRARYYSPVTGRYLQTDPVGYKDDLNLYAYVGGNPISLTDPSGMCATRHADGTCSVTVDPGTGAAGIKAGAALERQLNAYDKTVKSLDPSATVAVMDSGGNQIASMTGAEIQAIWAGTKFEISGEKFANGGAGGGTEGGWSGGRFTGQSTLNPGAVDRYQASAMSLGHTAAAGVDTLMFHELAHNTHAGISLNQMFPVTNTIDPRREEPTSSIGSSIAGTVGAAYICYTSGGCR